MTNADYIRNMNDEELARFLDEVQRQECEALHEMRPDGSLKFYSCQYGWWLWLKKEVEKRCTKSTSGSAPTAVRKWTEGIVDG